MTSKSLLALGLAGLFLCTTGLTSCSSAEETTSGGYTSPSHVKKRLLRRMENAIHEFKVYAKPKFRDIHDNARAEIAELERPLRLGVIDPVLSDYGADDEDAFFAAIDDIMSASVTEAEALLANIKTGLFTKAYELAKTDIRSHKEFATGYEDLDQMTLDAYDGLARVADLPGLKDLGHFGRGEVIRLSQSQRVDSLGIGRLALYLSDPLDGVVFPGQEGYAVVVTFDERGLGDDIDVELVQASRQRVIRGGTPLRDSGWQWDPNVPAQDGVLPEDPKFAVPGYAVSLPGFPAVNSGGSDFEAFHSHSIQIDYETVARRKDTGEWLAGLRWEIRWRVTHDGELILEAGNTPIKRLADDDFVIVNRLRDQMRVHIESPETNAEESAE